jgi:DNA polymerase III delta prime subunit
MNITVSNKNMDKKIKDKLDSFISQNKIPHILFHGPSDSEKRTLVYNFVSDIYTNNKELIKNYTLFADCAHGKGIKFVREELKFFAKTNVNIQGIGQFKTIILTNADKLTTDAQSALRRCIELFSHNTRFFIIVENKYSLLKPILSRLCEIYVGVKVPDVNTKGCSTTLSSIVEKLFPVDSGHDQAHDQVNDQVNDQAHDQANDQANDQASDQASNQASDQASDQAHVTTSLIIKTVDKLYEKGHSGLDLMNYIEKNPAILRKKDDSASDTLLQTYKLLMFFHKVKSEFRSEKIFMSFILTFLADSHTFNSHLENILSM